MGKNKNALLLGIAIGIDTLASVGALATYKESAATAPVHTMLGERATAQHVVTPAPAKPPKRPTTTTQPERPAKAPIETYTETQIIPQLETSGLQIVEPTNDAKNGVNQAGEFIVSSNEAYGVQFIFSPADAPKDPTQTMNVSVSAFGNLDTLRDGERRNHAINDTSPDFRHAEGLLATGCNYNPTNPDEALTFIHNAEQELGRALETDTAIDLNAIIQNLPSISFLNIYGLVLELQ